MPSYQASPVLQDWPGWSPYQQQTSAACVIESPMPAMLVGSGGAARARGVQTNATPRVTSSIRKRIVIPFTGIRRTVLGRADALFPFKRLVTPRTHPLG